MVMPGGIAAAPPDVDQALNRMLGRSSRPAGDDVLSLWLSLREVAGARDGDVERAAGDYLGDEVELGNTVVTALSTPGQAPAHAAYVVADRRRGTEAPWLAFTGDSLLVGDVGRPDLHAQGDPAAMARLLHASLTRLMELPDGVAVYPSHFGGSVCGRSLSGNPFSTIGFERRHNAALAHADADAFAAGLLAALPPAPADQEAIVAANRSGTVAAPA
jgi:hydroxyacylglutathione hydrolase